MRVPWTIRPADAPEDLEAVRVLFAEYAALLRETHGQCCLADFDQELAELPGAYGPPDGRLLVAAVGAEAAGCVGLRKLGAGICEMKRLYVRPAFRGLGIARGLTAAVIAEARRAGFARMCLDTLPAMTEARALYQALGFRPVPPYLDRHVPEALCFELALT
jgi:GNAT superfamily N-acetyltransferase